MGKYKIWKAIINGEEQYVATLTDTMQENDIVSVSKKLTRIGPGKYEVNTQGVHPMNYSYDCGVKSIETGSEKGCIDYNKGTVTVKCFVAEDAGYVNDNYSSLMHLAEVRTYSAPSEVTLSEICSFIPSGDDEFRYGIYVNFVNGDILTDGQIVADHWLYDDLSKTWDNGFIDMERSGEIRLKQQAGFTGYDFYSEKFNKSAAQKTITVIAFGAAG